MAPLSGWAGRLNRGYRNLMDNLLLFGAVVLTVHVTGAANETTALGAQIFFYSRIAHAVVYAIGIPYIRTLTYLAGLAGTIMVASVLF